jgi:predicted RNase H-like nuclease (RuvC/YqgF family)
MIDVCDQCQTLAAENAALQGEVKRLQQENKRLQARLKAIREFCERIYEKTQEILSRKSGVWRDKWHVVDGMNRIAAAVLQIGR